MSDKFELHAKFAPTVTVEAGFDAGEIELCIRDHYLTLTTDEAKTFAKALKDAANRTVVSE